MSTNNPKENLDAREQIFSLQREVERARDLARISQKRSQFYFITISFMAVGFSLLIAFGYNTFEKFYSIQPSAELMFMNVRKELGELEDVIASTTVELSNFIEQSNTLQKRLIVNSSEIDSIRHELNLLSEKVTRLEQSLVRLENVCTELVLT